MDRVCGVVAVEHDFAAVEVSPPGDREQQPNLLFGDIGEQTPLHATSLCREHDSVSVVAVNDAETISA